MMLETAGLRARIFEKQMLWQDLLVPNIVERLGPEPPDKYFRARALVASVLYCFDAVLAERAKSGGAVPIEDLLDRAIEAVRK